MPYDEDRSEFPEVIDCPADREPHLELSLREYDWSPVTTGGASTPTEEDLRRALAVLAVLEMEDEEMPFDRVH